MSWSLKWEGQVTSFMPEHLAAIGKPGRMAAVSQDAIWESVQKIAEQNPTAYARVVVNGWEDAERPGLGQFNLSVQVLDSDQPGSATNEIMGDIREQQPVDLLASRERSVTPSVPEPASSA